MSIRVAIIGVGNCAKSLVEGVVEYSSDAYNIEEGNRIGGLAFPIIGGYRPKDIHFVLAYDIDARKVGEPLHRAISAHPNCAMDLTTPGTIESYVSNRWGLDSDLSTEVMMGRIDDGVAPHMQAKKIYENDKFFVSSQREPSMNEVVDDLRDRKVDVALIYLPVGSQSAVEFYVEACLQAKVPFVNCIPVFIVSSPSWKQRIIDAGIPAIGDDMRSQVGASILSQVLQEMFLDRGAKVNFHCQTNQGGNTDFLNMKSEERLISKKISKMNVITSQNDIRDIETEMDSIHAGPSDYIPYLGDNKVAHFRIEAEGFCGAPITLDARLSVQDSPNSAGVVIDAIRLLHTARRQGIVGPLEGPSAFTQKTPPVQMRYQDAYNACKALADVRFEDGKDSTDSDLTT